MVNLKSHEVFCSQLVEKCGVDQEAAEKEWGRRKGLPHKYEQGCDDRGSLIIELDIEDFKMNEVRKARLLQDAVLALQEAEKRGNIANLEAAVKKAETDKMSLILEVPDDQLAPLRTELQTA